MFVVVLFANFSWKEGSRTPLSRSPLSALPFRSPLPALFLFSVLLYNGDSKSRRSGHPGSDSTTTLVS